MYVCYYVQVYDTSVCAYGHVMAARDLLFTGLYMGQISSIKLSVTVQWVIVFLALSYIMDLSQLLPIMRLQWVIVFLASNKTATRTSLS